MAGEPSADRSRLGTESGSTSAAVARRTPGAVPSGRGRTPQAPVVEVNIFTRRRRMYCSLWYSESSGPPAQPAAAARYRLAPKIQRERSNLPERTMSRPRVDGVE